MTNELTPAERTEVEHRGMRTEPSGNVLYNLMESTYPSTITHDLCVFICRAQIFHEGHRTVIREALSRGKYVCILIGSTGEPRSHRNPFTYDERYRMIVNSFTENENWRLFIHPLEDHAYNEEKWIAEVQSAVSEATAYAKDRIRETTGALSSVNKIALIGHNKDHTSYYLNMFPQWDSINVDYHRSLSSSPMREAYFSNICYMWLKDCDGHKVGDLVQDHLVPPNVKEFLAEFSLTDAYKHIRDEYEFITKYKSQFVSLPYPPTFVTVDAVVVQSGHVLLVRRGGMPGKNLLALPGGFLNQNETIEQGMIRELREETRIKVPEPVLRGSIVTKEVFDNPHRSARGRTITHAFLVHLKKGPLPKVIGSDDAIHAKFVPLSEIKRNELFEDHYEIISVLLDRLPTKSPK